MLIMFEELLYSDIMGKICDLFISNQFIISIIIILILSNNNLIYLLNR